MGVHTIHNLAGELNPVVLLRFVVKVDPFEEEQDDGRAPEYCAYSLTGDAKTRQRPNVPTRMP